MWNDIIDRNLDAQVARTRDRPVASGVISVRAALAFAMALSLIGLIVVLQLRPVAQVIAIASLALVRRWTFVKRAYWDAMADCWRLRQHVRAERRRIRQFRRRGDLWMLRFLRWRLNRWDEVQRLRRFGVPRVTPS